MLRDERQTEFAFSRTDLPDSRQKLIGKPPDLSRTGAAGPDKENELITCRPVSNEPSIERAVSPDSGLMG